MGLSTLLVAAAVVAAGNRISPDEVQHQQDAFELIWGGEEFVWNFAQLPRKGGVPQYRIPYSGYIYPDKQGGTTRIMRKYDAAFHRGKRLAADYEHWDSTAFKEKVPGLFGDVFGVKHTPDWWGHCNGWTAATILHAESQRTVIRNGVAFSPADIKGLLAELYIYNEHIVLGGENESPITAGAFHAIIANWLGRQQQAVGMEADPTKEKWNYPAYAYSSSFAKRSARHVEVNMNLVYAVDSDDEWDESPYIHEVKFFHYMLELDSRGDIVGGYFFSDSSNIDMLWYPVAAREPGHAGNEDGNPHLSAKTILDIWRDSVSPEVRKQWLDTNRRPPASEELATSASEAPPTVETVRAQNEAADTALAEAPTAKTEETEPLPALSRYIVVPSAREGCRPARRSLTDSTDAFNALLHGSPIRTSQAPSGTSAR